MSFSAETKRELAGLWPAAACCRGAELAGLLVAGSLPAGGGAWVTLPAAATARKVYRLARALARRPPRVEIGRGAAPAGRRPCRVWVPAEGLRAGAPLPAAGCCRRAYLRGAFLACGFLTQPEKGYHLELSLRDADRARELEGLLRGFGLRAGRHSRNEHAVVYLKGAEDIASFLALVGASGAVLWLEEKRVVKAVRGRINRLVNAETANVAKTVAASMEQAADIRSLAAGVGLDRLPPSLAELARLRLENPYATLKELGEALTPPLSKSAVNHRMRRLSALARRLRDPEA